MWELPMPCPVFATSAASTIEPSLMVQEGSDKSLLDVTSSSRRPSSFEPHTNSWPVEVPLTRGRNVPPRRIVFFGWYGFLPSFAVVKIPPSVLTSVAVAVQSTPF